MKSTLAKALVTAGAALSLAAVAAPAHADATAGGGGEYIASAEHPFVFAASEEYGFAATDTVFVGGTAWNWATGSTAGSGFEGVAIIEGH
ncbi:hypothetical protein ACFYT4_04195 [Streptomyces sp. NPDC004609]|uniref:hypothetical protein n=1 Tax=Streptomyces sp. NPDC004609 TaxID=3364704 RepID=UPI0036ABDE30